MSADPVRRPAGTVYGPIVTGATVERAALATMRDHARAYIDETCRQEGRDPLPDPRGYIVASTFSKWPEDQLPVVVAISPGWAGRPRRAGNGLTLVQWSLAAGVVASAKDLGRTRENAQIYVAALRTLLAQEQSLGGLAAGVDCIDEDYIPPFPFSRTRTLLAVQAIFVVTVPDVFTYGAGAGRWRPPEPTNPTDPPDWPRVKRTDIRLTLTDNPAAPASQED